MCNRLFGTPDEVVINLHGSFAKVYKGHGTDKALVAGLIGMDSDNPQLANSFNIANRLGMKFSFKKEDLGEEAHPNSVKFEIRTGKESFTLIGSSIGGGNICVKSINGLKLDGIDGASELTLLSGADPEELNRFIKQCSESNLKVYSDLNSQTGLTLVKGKVKDSLRNEVYKLSSGQNFWFKHASALK
jgi:L-serine dehydratase